jgi:primosomal protein N' (replication factor Y) (superfamily II helicase)
VGLARIDRDTTRRKGALDRLLDEVHSGQARLLIGTQMLAKGHDFPEVTLVGVLNADAGLFSADFRAPERMAQLITQVAGRAGRASRPGEVYIQTHQPQHPLLNQLIRAGYRAFAEAALEERREAGYPPYGHLALLRAESVQPAAAMQFLEEAAALARATLPKALELWGPVPAPMERRAGRVRAQLLLQSDTRKPLHALLREWVPQLDRLPAARRARWSLDVDPQDLM